MEEAKASASITARDGCVDRNNGKYAQDNGRHSAYSLTNSASVRSFAGCLQTSTN